MTDDQVLNYLRGRSRVTPPPDFVDAVSRAVADVPQRRGAWFAPFVPAAAAVAAVAAIAALVIILGRAPNVGPTPTTSPSPSASASASVAAAEPSTPPAPGDRLLEPGDVVEMPAFDDVGEWGTIRLERGDEIATDPEVSTSAEGSFLIEVHVTYTARRETSQTFGFLDWGLRVPDGVSGAEFPGFLPASADPDRPASDLLENGSSAAAGDIIEGWVALEVPAVERTPAVYVTYQGGERPGGSSSLPRWEVLVRDRERNNAPAEGHALLSSGDATLVPAVAPDGEFGTITLDRGDDVGGFPLVSDPISQNHFFIEILATYELDRFPAGIEWGQFDWRVEGGEGPVGAELLDAFPPIRGRNGLGHWPGATVPEDRYEGWIIFAVPREAANADLELVYQPAGVADATRIPVRSPGEPPAPVAAEWPRPDPVYVAQEGLPFTVLESSEADALMVDADTCTNPAGGYTVSYPDSWYTNTELDNVPACSWFSPTFYELNASGERPEEIAINITVFDGAVGFIWADLYSEQLTVDGFDARRAETGMTKDPDMPTDTFQYDYLVRLDANSDGRKLWAFTGTDYGGDYELNKAILDRIMASLEFTD